MTDSARAAIPHRQNAERCAASFAQRRLWFLDQFTPGHTVYNLPVAIRLRTPLNIGALERSLTELVARHEVLRTTFDDEDGEPVQVIAPAGPVSLPVVDLQHLPPEARQQEAERL
ncbi:MAG TPA: condensation domain-containing protein, partial [Vicinamibacterales bacterium]|nr:condensation domain-containing protein [Vicinamibacterales bacterium]